MDSNSLILSIESSCDDSSIAVTRINDYKILFHQKISQDLEHSNYGGVVPEIASRLHAVILQKILFLIKMNLEVHMKENKFQVMRKIRLQILR